MAGETSWFGTIANWYNNNKDWVKPVAQAGLSALQQSNTDNAQGEYLQYLREREDQNFQDTLASIDMYNQQLSAAGGGGGGGGGGNSAAAAAAAAATEKNRQKALKQSNKAMQNTYKELLKVYQPYRETADMILPQMAQVYQGSVGLQNNLANYIQRPDQMAKLDGAVPAWNVNIPLPDSVRIK